MAGINWNLLNTDAPAQVGAAFTKIDPIGSYMKGQDQALMRQQKQQGIQRNALAMQQQQQSIKQQQTMQPLQQEQLKLSNQGAAIGNQKKLINLGIQSAQAVSRAPQGQAYVTAVRLARKNAQIMQMPPAQLNQVLSKLQTTFDQGGDEGVRASAGKAGATLQDKLKQDQLSLEQRKQTLAEDKFTAKQATPSDIYEGLTIGYEQFLRINNQQPSPESFAAYQESEANTFKGQMQKGNLKLGQRKQTFKELEAEAAKTSAVTLSPKATIDAGFRYLTDGTTPSVGRGAEAGKAKLAAVNMGTIIGDRLGIPVENRRGFQLSTAAKKSGLMQLKRSQAQVSSFERTFQKNIKLARKASKETSRTGIPVLNAWIQAGKRAVVGDVALSKFDIAVKAVTNEYTKIISGSMGNTAIAQQEIEKVNKLLATAQTEKQVQAVLDFMVKETDNRMKGFKEENAIIEESFLLPGSKGFGEGGEKVKLPNLLTVTNPNTGEEETWDLSTETRVK